MYLFLIYIYLHTKIIYFYSGEFIINLNNLEILSSIEEFDNKKINFEKGKY